MRQHTNKQVNFKGNQLKEQFLNKTKIKCKATKNLNTRQKKRRQD